MSHMRWNLISYRSYLTCLSKTYVRGVLSFSCFNLHLVHPHIWHNGVWLAYLQLCSQVLLTSVFAVHLLHQSKLVFCGESSSGCGCFDTEGCDLETPLLHKLDLYCPCRVRHLESWHVTRIQTKHFLGTR